MLRRILQPALSLLLIGSILFTTASPVRSCDIQEQVFQSSDSGFDLFAALYGDDQEDSPLSLPVTDLFSIEWDLEEESETNKRQTPFTAILFVAQSSLNGINAPPAQTTGGYNAHFANIPLYLIFQVFRI